ncbi:hypothetical protein [Paenibacillus antarcticus]|uniref:Uncharacterized protein n=1 Tax=Paenibacillus antarcticus TaxID=253703 RepID=A0A168R2F2_9BACL|nr:hypothetical protein [Paenibacillus antarcticus]OAB48501.1 hypothetical protein PBAT_02385 [Paenibacillus antarcticus]
MNHNNNNEIKAVENAELMTKIILLLSENGLSVNQACDLLNTAKFQMMHYTKIDNNFNDLIRDAVMIERVQQEVSF